MKPLKADKVFIATTFILVLTGLIIFISASMGVLAKGGDNFTSIVFKQILFGVVFGSIALGITSQIDYHRFREVALYFFIASLITTILVFVPVIGLGEVNGAKRWINLGFTTFQPAELLKLSTIIYLAAWFASVKDRVRTFKYGTLPLIIVLSITGIVMLLQPDTDTFVVIVCASLCMYVAAGGKWSHFLIIALIGLVGLAGLVTMRPYLKQRVMSFFDPASNALTTSWQIQQSLIAIGSGGVTGRGFGQSIQKFNYLPESRSDSIFAVAGEEFGFIGTALITVLFVLFSIKGLQIALRTHDSFGKILTVGIVILIVCQSFINISSTLGLIPLSGLPLMFVSQGGTAMLFGMAAVGIVINISKHQKKSLII